MNKIVEIFRTPLADLPVGSSFVNNGKVIIFKTEDGKVKATKNKCKHSSGRFKPCASTQKVVECPYHGWTLNLDKMEYENPTGGLKQEELILEIEGQILSVKENVLDEDFFNVHPRAVETPDINIQFMAHACAIISTPDFSIATDPWLEGPAFLTGWWLKYAPPSDWLEKITKVNYIYVSHNHSDHFNVHTLALIKKHKPDMAFVIPNFENESVLRPLREMGFTNIKTLNFGEWLNVTPDTSIMILQDASGRDDSGLLVDHKGYKILNVVDCLNINGGALPKVDVLFQPFAGGASGFPVCWEDMYPLEKIEQIVSRNKSKIITMALDIIAKTSPSLVIPFAGYFTEANPADARIKELNIKNSPYDLKKIVEKNTPNCEVWCPVGGAVYSMKAHKEVDAGFDRSPEYAFDLYSEKIDNFVAEFSKFPLKQILQKYFEWANFSGDILLKLDLTDENYKSLQSFWVDFKTNKVYENENEAPKRTQFSQIKVRKNMFMYTVLKGIPWEEFSIGFQARFYRSPDVYEFDMWNHFQNKLEEKPFYSNLI